MFCIDGNRMNLCVCFMDANTIHEASSAVIILNNSKFIKDKEWSKSLGEALNVIIVCYPIIDFSVNIAVKCYEGYNYSNYETNHLNRIRERMQ